MRSPELDLSFLHRISQRVKKKLLMLAINSHKQHPLFISDFQRYTKDFFFIAAKKLGNDYP